MIPYGRQDVTEADIQAVEAVLRSPFLTQGPAVPRFEEAVRKVAGAEHAVAMNSATSALHAACAALDLGPGDWLWTTPNTFVASANCGLYCGARVDFVDIDRRTWNLCPKALAVKLERAKAEGRLPKVLVAVHFSGQSCYMAGIRALGDRYGFRVIEDASHAIGGSYRGDPIGTCRYSDITVFSFHPVKIVTTAEGGVAVTNDPELAARMARFRTHGITKEPAELLDKDPGGWYYEQHDLGFNYRMTELQAALGASQMERLDAYVARRRELARRYDTLLADLPVTLPYQGEPGASAWHLYVIRIDQARAGVTRREVFEKMRERGIGVHVHYIPVHTQPHYRAMGFGWGQFPEAEAYYQEALSLPLFPGLTEGEQDEVVGVLSAALRSPIGMVNR
jgi:UDP-4-amino-4,6-dideoxy-N-acetyl-beta-L-altrosamine transaminase